MVSVFDYLSYREFLSDFYAEQKRSKSFFSYQYFADKAGFKSKSFIYKVIKGEKALSKRSSLMIMKAVGLKKKEADYFENLVSFNNAATHEEKEFYFHRLQSLSRNHIASKIRKNQYAYFSQWYNVVIRELVTFLDWKEDYKILAKTVNPPITVKQAENAVKLLLNLGMIQRTPEGKYVQLNKALTAGEEIIVLAVRQFQKQHMTLASDALDRLPRQQRDISTLTMGISKEGFEKIRQEIKAFRETLVSIVSNDEPADRVYQCNFQFFPLTEVQENG